MTTDQKRAMKDTVRTAAKDAAVGLVEKSVDKKKDRIQKKVRKRVRRVVRGCVIAGGMFCVGYAVGVPRKEIGAYLKETLLGKSA